MSPKNAVRAKKAPKEILATGRRLQFVSAGGWEYVERIHATGVVAVVAVTEANEIILTEQFRTPVEGRVIDLCAGLVGDTAGAREEDPSIAARRELIEETGFDARKFEF